MLPSPSAKSSDSDEAVSETPLPPATLRPPTWPSAQTQPASPSVASSRSHSTPRSISEKFSPTPLVLPGSSPKAPEAFSRPRVKTSTVRVPKTQSLVNPIVAAPLRLRPWPRAMSPLKLKLVLSRK